jgi:hypothetical protein
MYIALLKVGAVISQLTLADSVNVDQLRLMHAVQSLCLFRSPEVDSFGIASNADFVIFQQRQPAPSCPLNGGGLPFSGYGPVGFRSRSLLGHPRFPTGWLHFKDQSGSTIEAMKVVPFQLSCRSLHIVVEAINVFNIPKID